jgi:hypothetical protein
MRFGSLVDAALHCKERLILSGKIHETFFNFLGTCMVIYHWLICQKLILIYTANISIAGIKILLMIRYCVHEIMLFCVSTGLCGFIARLPVLNTCNLYCGCFYMFIWCEIFILAHHIVHD